MTYKMFIDDERTPVNDDFIVVRTFDQFMKVLDDIGPPEYISFDHDLGSNDYDGYVIAKLLVDMDMDKGGQWLPDNFDFYVHSANPVGKLNIESCLNSYLKHKRSS